MDMNLELFARREIAPTISVQRRSDTGVRVG